MKSNVALCYRHPRLVFAFVYMAEPYSKAELLNLESRADYQAGIYGVTGRVEASDSSRGQAFLVILEPAVKVTDDLMRQFISNVFTKGPLVARWETDQQKLDEALEVALKMIS